MTKTIFEILDYVREEVIEESKKDLRILHPDWSDDRIQSKAERGFALATLAIAEKLTSSNSGVRTVQ